MHFLGTISFGEFSSVLEQSVPVQDAESGSTETAGMDTVDASVTQASLHSIVSGQYCIMLFSTFNFVLLSLVTFGSICWEVIN